LPRSCWACTAQRHAATDWLFEYISLELSIRSSPSNLRKQVGLAHDTQKRLEIHCFFFLPLDQAANTPDTVGLIALLLAFHNQIDQPLVLGHFLLNLAPGIISTARNLKCFAHGLNRIGVAKTLNDTIFQFHLLPTSNKNFAATLPAFAVSATRSAAGLPCFPAIFGDGLEGVVHNLDQSPVPDGLLD